MCVCIHTRTNGSRQVPTYLVFIEEHVELSNADTQVRFVELVPNVPAQGTELSPLLHHRMEEAESKQELLERLRLLVAFEPLRVVDGIALVRTGNVCA